MWAGFDAFKEAYFTFATDFQKRTKFYHNVYFAISIRILTQAWVIWVKF